MSNDDVKVKFGGDTTALDKKMKGISKSAKSFSGALGAIGVGVSAAGLISYTEKIVNLNDKIGKTSQKLGITTDALQKYQYGANKSGVSTDTFNMAFQRFVRRSSEAANGTGEALKAFQELNIGMKDGEGRMKSTEQLFNEVADAISSVQDPAARVRLAMRFFDSEGVSLVNMLSNGSEGLKRFGDEAEQAGIIIDSKTIKASEKLKDDMLLLNKQITALVTKSGFITWLSDLADKMKYLGEVMKDWKIDSGFGTVEDRAERLAKLGLKRAGIKSDLPSLKAPTENEVENANKQRAGRAEARKNAAEAAALAEEKRDQEEFDMLLAKSREKDAKEAEKQAQKQKSYNEELRHTIKILQMIKDGKEKEAKIEDEIFKARKQGIELTPEVMQRIREKVNLESPEQKIGIVSQRSKDLSDRLLRVGGKIGETANRGIGRNLDKDRNAFLREIAKNTRDMNTDMELQ